VVSLGHTNASYEEFRAGVDHGATMATHLYSAMSGFLHRAPGAVGAALLDDRVTAGLIVDGVHSHPASVKLAIRAKGPERIALVTDAIAGPARAPASTRSTDRTSWSRRRRALPTAPWPARS
jgi:N-acetylglucosamine-6-phosphate deacetylase